MDATSDSGKAKASDTKASDSADKPSGDLPNVESPALAPGQSEPARNTKETGAKENAEPGPVSGHRVSTAVAIFKGAHADAAPELDPSPSLLRRLRAKAQLPPMAASAVLILGIGVLGGTLGIYGLTQWLDAPREAQTRETALNETIARLGAEVAALKDAQAVAAKASSTQMTHLAERLDKAERAQAEPAAKVARLSETVTQLERRIVTASSASAAPATVSAAAAPAASSVQPGNRADITGAIPQPRAAPKDMSRLPVIPGWVLQRVIGGTAIIHSREGLIEVGVGDALPGGGRVEDIRRLDGRWIVVTSRGLVTMR